MDRHAASNKLLKQQIQFIESKVESFVDSVGKKDNADTRTVYLLDGGQITSVPFGDLVPGKHFVSSR